jgi:hypothetical protein
MRDEIFWVVYEEEKKTRKWVDMPKEYLGSPLYEHATDYITILETGERVMVRKKDGFVFENSGVSSSDKSHLATPEEIEKLRADARRKAEERRRRGLQRGKHISHSFVGTLLESSKDGKWQVVSTGKVGRWVNMPKNYKGKPILEYWNVYLTELETGERVYINKRTGKIADEELLQRRGTRTSNKAKRRNTSLKTISLDKIIADGYDETVPWVVDLDSYKRDSWYPMPIDFKGKPTYESWDSYITKLSDGSKVAISKKTNKQIIEGIPLKDKLPDRGSNKFKQSANEFPLNSEESKKVKESQQGKKALSTGLRVVSSKEELLELQVKSQANKREVNKKGKE